MMDGNEDVWKLIIIVNHHCWTCFLFSSFPFVWPASIPFLSSLVLPPFLFAFRFCFYGCDNSARQYAFSWYVFFSFFLWERRGGEGRGGGGGKNGLLKEFFSPCLDANTRQDATQKLETASRENYVCLLPLLLHWSFFLLMDESCSLNIWLCCHRCSMMRRNLYMCGM